MTGAPIPNDWDGVSWATFDVTIPDSSLWRSLLRGGLSGFSLPEFWDEDTGDINNVVEIGKEIITRNSNTNLFPPYHSEDSTKMYISRTQLASDVTIGPDWTAGQKVLVCELPYLNVHENTYQWHFCSLWGWMSGATAHWIAYTADLVRDSDGYKQIDNWQLGGKYFNINNQHYTLTSSWMSGNTPAPYSAPHTWKVYAQTPLSSPIGLNLFIAAGSYPWMSRVRIETHHYYSISE